MSRLWITVSDLPAEGREFSFADHTQWADGLDELAPPVTAETPLEAAAFVLAQGDGVLVRGTINGTLGLPCDRCAEPYTLALDCSFEDYESLAGEDDEPDAQPRLVEDGGELKLDLGAMLWEQLMLSLPVKPLCGEDCKGICPDCGANLNRGQCDCVREEGDLRLAVFRNLKVNK